MGNINTIAIPQGISARSIVGPVDLSQRLRDADALKEAVSLAASVGLAVWDVAYGELASIADEILGLDVAEALLSCWSKSKELVDAGTATRGTDIRQVVPLVTRDAQFIKHPTVDVVLHRKRLGSVTFDLTVALSVDALTGTVRDGALVELTSGQCKATVTLTLGRTVLATGSRAIEAYLKTGLGNGIALPTFPSQRAPQDRASVSGGGAHV